MDIFRIISEELKNIEENTDTSKKTIEEFYRENNIDPDNLSWLGKGDFGEAYSIGDGRVLKNTTSNSEFKIAKQLENKNIPALSGFAKIYKTEKVGDDMLIIVEELDTDSEIEDLYYELSSMIEEQGIPIQYFDHFDFDEYEGEVSDELQKFMDDMHDIVGSYRYLGIEASDIKPDNMGYDSNGKLKAFDIEDRRDVGRW